MGYVDRIGMFPHPPKPAGRPVPAATGRIRSGSWFGSPCLVGTFQACQRVYDFRRRWLGGSRRGMTPMLPTIGKTIWRPSPATLGQNSAHVMPSACAATAADSRFFLLTLSLTPDGSDTSDTFFALCYPLPLTPVFLAFSLFSHTRWDTIETKCPKCPKVSGFPVC